MSQNPFRAGAGHPPPYLAGREGEKTEFHRLLQQSAITTNMVLTGLRGIGKTVLLNELKPIARKNGWRWTGTDLSEMASISELNLAIRILADLSTVTSQFETGSSNSTGIGFNRGESAEFYDFDYLSNFFQSVPGLISDKLKGTIRHVINSIPEDIKIVFAYDEAQNLTDHSAKDQFPLSMLLETFQMLQREGVKFFLALAGLPTLFPKLVESRTYAERMFKVITLGPLSEEESLEAIKKPILQAKLPFSPTDESYSVLRRISGGYPYFIQFFCHEMYEIWLNQGISNSIPTSTLTAKLDADFFSGRWENLTDRQRDLLFVIASLETVDREFTVQDCVEKSKHTNAPFSASQISQLLATLGNKGLVYRLRHGKYDLAVPMLKEFINRVSASSPSLP